MAAFTHFHYQFYHILASIIIPLPFYVMFMSFYLANYLIIYSWLVRVSSLASFYPFFICMFVRPTVRPSIRPPCLSTILSPSVSMYTSGSPLQKDAKNVADDEKAMIYHIVCTQTILETGEKKNTTTTATITTANNCWN